jgi:hypothetical protein
MVHLNAAPLILLAIPIALLVVVGARQHSHRKLRRLHDQMRLDLRQAAAVRSEALLHIRESNRIIHSILEELQRGDHPPSHSLLRLVRNNSADQDRRKK